MLLLPASATLAEKRLNAAWCAIEGNSEQLVTVETPVWDLKQLSHNVKCGSQSERRQLCKW